MAKRSFDRPERHAHAGAWLGAKVSCLGGPGFLSIAGHPANGGASVRGAWGSQGAPAYSAPGAIGTPHIPVGRVLPPECPSGMRTPKQEL
jgi:hypothetical protein